MGSLGGGRAFFRGRNLPRLHHKLTLSQHALRSQGTQIPNAKLRLAGTPGNHSRGNHVRVIGPSCGVRVAVLVGRAV